MKKGMKILIAYDGSEHSKHALDQGVNLAKLTDSEITVLSVVPRVVRPFLSGEATGRAPISAAQEMTEIRQDMKEYYSESLENVIDEISEKHPELEADKELLEGRPSSTIVEKAEKDEYDLIVIGSRGLGGITGWILGSTSSRVVDSCKIPVLVVK